MKKHVCTLIICICIAVFCYSGYKVFEYVQERRESNDTYAGLSEYVNIPSKPELAQKSDETALEDELMVAGEQSIVDEMTVADEQSVEDRPTVAGEVPETRDSFLTGDLSEKNASVSDTAIQQEILWPKVDFDALKAINPDIVGWLYSEGTNINYPVVRGSDNSYYLNHMFDGKYNASGCLFADYRIDELFESDHTIIYGHHMKNGTMFHDLDGYKDETYYQEHPTMLLLTPDKNYEIVLFAAYVASVETDAWCLDFPDENEKEKWLRNAVEKSFFSTDIQPSPTDRIITLSTCSYEFDDARLVVVGILR